MSVGSYIILTKQHPDYGSGTGFSPNDIAILILDDPNGATSGKALPMAGPGANFDGQTCHISGWGVTKSK